MALKGVAYEDAAPSKTRLDEDGLRRKDTVASENWVWDPIGLAWVRMTQPGGAGGGGGGPATIADGADIAEGATTDAVWVSGGNGSLIALNKYEAQKLEAIRALLAGALTVNVGLTDTQLRASAVPISAAQLPAALAASGGMKVEGVAGGVAQPVSGAFFQATQPVSLAAAVDVSDRAARLVGRARLTDDTNLSTIKAASAIAAAADTALVVQHSPQRADAATLGVTAVSAANAAVTLTIPAAAAGLFHYITSIEIVALNPTITAIAAAATILTFTTTNLPGSPAWSAGTLLAAGTEKVITRYSPTTPIKSSVAATATTIVAPAVGTGGLCRINVSYYTAP